MVSKISLSIVVDWLISPLLLPIFSGFLIEFRSLISGDKFLDLSCFFLWQWGWRCRAKLAVRGSSDNALIGLYQEGTHTVVDIPECKGILITNHFLDIDFRFS